MVARAPETGSTSVTASAVDFDLHGIVGIRLIGASGADVGRVASSLGVTQRPLSREPDIVVRFVERLDMEGPARLLGLNEAAFTDGSFYVLRGSQKARTTARFDFATVGSGCQITCESGAAVPLLVPILNLVALANGFVPLHGSAFQYRGRGVVVVGWAKGGKTELLLAFMRKGAEYIGDEWIYLPSGGDRVYGLPEPIKLWDWHLDDLPEYRARLTRPQLWKLRSVTGAHSLLSFPSKGLMPRVQALVGRQRYIHIRPENLFGSAHCKREGRFDNLVFVVSHESDATVVHDAEPLEVARRMTSSLAYERLPLTSAYLKYLFAFPGRRSRLIDQAPGTERELLDAALTGKRAHVLYHPFPASIPDMFKVLEPVLAQ